MAYSAAFASSLTDQIVECRLCPHRCVLSPGEQGKCHVRENHDGQMKVTNYGRPVAVLVEPIEKKTLFHFHPGSQTLSLGTNGCNLQCAGCINWRFSQSGTTVDHTITSPDTIVAQARQCGVSGIAFTYTEPAIFYEYARDIASLARSAGLYVVAKSNGFMLPNVFKSMSTWLDAINIDLKGWRGPLHRQIVGGSVGPILQTLKLARRFGLWLEVSTLLVPGFNDDVKTLTNMANFLSTELGPQTPWHILRFFPEYHQGDIHPTSQSELLRAVEIGKKAGLHYVYNRTLSQGQWLQTRCPDCQTLLIERQPDGLLNMDLQKGHCPQCGRLIPGRWSFSTLSGENYD